MKEIRYWFVGTCIWLITFFSLERLNSDINIASFVYIYAAAWAVLIILVPRLQRINRFVLLVVAFLPYVILKQYLGYSMLGAQLSITVFEAAALGLTLLLVGGTAHRLEAIQEIIANLTIGNLKEKTTPFETGQGRLYQEIRRARYFEHPATLLSLSVTEESIEFSLDHFIVEAQGTIINQFISAHIAQLLVRQLKDCDLITQNGNHFVVLLPETNFDDAVNTIEKLKQAARKELNLELKVGVSTFPDEAVTLESLVERAQENMVSAEAPPKDASRYHAAVAIATDDSTKVAGARDVTHIAATYNNER
jgi:hypothetical protein